MSAAVALVGARLAARAPPPAGPCGTLVRRLAGQPEGLGSSSSDQSNTVPSGTRPARTETHRSAAALGSKPEEDGTAAEPGPNTPIPLTPDEIAPSLDEEMEKRQEHGGRVGGTGPQKDQGDEEETMRRREEAHHVMDYSS